MNENILLCWILVPFGIIILLLLAWGIREFILDTIDEIEDRRRRNK